MILTLYPKTLETFETFILDAAETLEAGFLLSSKAFSGAHTHTQKQTH